jgi:hypothetical protein
MRRGVFALAVLASWMILVLWAAGVEWRTPLSPAGQREFRGSEFAPVFGTAQADAERLRVESTSVDHTSLQSLRTVSVDAADLSVLRYRFAHFPRTLELSLVFRTADEPNDVHTIALPWPGNATGTFDLGPVPAWRGRIVELGFAQFPTAQLVPPSQGFKPFEIVDASLWSPSWRGNLAALATDWFGAWPWTQRSVHALGRDTEAPRARPLVLCVALAAALVVIWAVALFGRRDRRIALYAASSLAIGWLVLDLCWQSGLWDRLQTTRAVYADLSWSERQRTVADTYIAEAAEELRLMLRDEPPERRIFVQAGSGYELLRLIWHLLPSNAAAYAHAAFVGPSIPEDSLIVFFDSDDWRTQSVWRRLLAHSEHLATSASIHGDSFEDERLVVFRFHHGR